MNSRLHEDDDLLTAEEEDAEHVDDDLQTLFASVSPASDDEQD